MSSAFSITGFGFSFDDEENEITTITGPATLSLSFATDTPVLNYTQITITNPGGSVDIGLLPDVSFDGGEQPTGISINGVQVNRDDAFPSIGRVTWDDGGVTRQTDIFNIFISDAEQYAFVVGGDPLPEDLDAGAYNAILMSAIMANGGPDALPLPLPPSTSDFPPDADIALAGLSGWTQEPVVIQESPVAFTITGFSFNTDGFDSDEELDLQETQLSFAFPSADVVMSYTQVGLLAEEDFDGDGFAVVEFDFTAPPLGLFFGGRPQSFDDGDYSLEMARIVTSAGTHDILLIDDEINGKQYLFQLGGDPLSITSLAEFEAFFATVTSLNPIPDGTPLGQGQPIAPGSLPGAVTTPLVPYALAGYQVGYNTAISDDPQSIAGAQMTILAPEGGVLTYEILEDDIFGPIFDDEGLSVALNSPGPFVVQVPGLDAPLFLQTQIVRLTDGEGVSYDILEFINPTGGDTNLDFFFQIGGPELNFDTLAEFNAFRATITSAGPIPPGDPLGPDTPIPLAGLGFAPGDAPTPPGPATGTGDPAIIQFSGYRIDEDEDDNLLGFGAAQLTLALSADDNVYSYVVLPDPDGDGLDPINITGSNPYAFLIDGVTPFVDPVIEIARITVEGVAYDVMLVQIGDSDTTYVFQIDGATPLPFTDFAAVEDFIEAADAPGAFGPIPPGSPFAPGTEFSFLNSPYATASTDPEIIRGGDGYETPPGYGVADGAGTEGSLTVVNGETLVLNTGAAGEGPFLTVGRGAEASGSVIVAGPGSGIELRGGGSEAAGVNVNIGRDGGFGELQVTDRALFQITDPTGTSGGVDGDGRETLQVGRGADSDGRIDISGGTFIHSGTGTGASFGRDGGMAALIIENGTYRQETTTPGDFTFMAIGNDGGAGSATINDGRLTIQAGNDGTLDIGRFGGLGEMSITSTREPGAFAEHGAMIIGGADSPFIQANVGYGGAGIVAVSGGYFGVLNRGISYDDDLNQISLGGDGGEAALRVGRDADGIGRLTAMEEAEVFVLGTFGAQLQIGAGAGSDGAVMIDGSELLVQASSGVAGIEVGAWNGGTGMLELLQEAEAVVHGGTGAFVNVGRGAGNTGEMILQQGSELLLRGDSNFTSMEIGAFGGAGAATLLSGATIRAEGVNSFLGIGVTDETDTSGATDGSLVVNGAGSRVTGFRDTFVGAHDASGTLRVEDGAAVQLGAPGGNTSLFVGRDTGGDGTLIVSDALLSIYAPTEGGHQPYTAFGYMGGTAQVEIDGQRDLGGDPAHGFIQLGGGGSAFATLDIGRGAGSTGVVSVTGAFFGTQNNGRSFDVNPPYGEIDLDGDGGRATIRIGIEGGEGSLTAGPDTDIFAQGGANGAAIVVGENGGTGSFTLAGGEMMIEGAEGVAFLGIGSGGTGEMTMSNGAEGRIELLSGQTGFQEAGIGVGYQGSAGGGYGQGTLIIDGAGTELEVVSARFANLNVGGIDRADGAGDGLLRVTNGAALRYESAEAQQLSIGRAGGDGVFEVLNGGTFAARTTGANADAFLFVGTEGGSGALRVDNASFSLVSEQDNAGVRVGTRFTHTEDNTGNGSLILENGAGALIQGAGTSNLWVGGLEGGNGSAIIRSGADLAMVGPDSFAIIGGVFAMMDEAGGTGSLEVTGAGSTLTGADTLLIGFNNGTGTLDVSDGAMVEIDGSATRAFLGIGVHSSATGNGGTGSATLDGLGSVIAVRGPDAEAIVGGQASSGTLAITNGAQVQIEAEGGGTTGASLDIGMEGGSGTVSLSGTGSALSVTGEAGAGGAIRVAADGAGSFGLLHIAAGATATAGSLAAGGVDATGAVVLEDGGALVADAISIAAGGILAGSGTITGDVTITGGTLRAGDTWDVADGATGGAAGIGTLNVTGSLAQTGGTAVFDVGASTGDLLDVTGALSFANTGFTLAYDGTLPTGGYEVQLAQAAGGITLDGISLTSPFDGLDGAAPELELRNGDTELWFVSGADLPPPTGQALILEELGREGATITYGVRIDPALVTGGALDDLDFTLNFNTDLITYVEGSISGGFTATPGSLVISGSSLNITDLAAPVLSFDMALTALPGARDISFDLTGVSVNGVTMEDQTGEDAPGFSYTPAFFTLSGAVGIRDARPEPTGPEGTEVTFTETGSGTVHSTVLDETGAFSFLLEEGTAGTLEIARDYAPAPGGPDKALGIQDVLNLFRLVVEATNETPEADDFIAGDFDGNGVVNIQDVLGLFRHVVNAQPAPDPAYLFVDQADMPAASLGGVPTLPGSFDVAALGADAEFSFLGILTGDLQGHV